MYKQILTGFYPFGVKKITVCEKVLIFAGGG
jgi:hypothetical protein